MRKNLSNALFSFVSTAARFKQMRHIDRGGDPSPEVPRLLGTIASLTREFDAFSEIANEKGDYRPVEVEPSFDPQIRKVL